LFLYLFWKGHRAAEVIRVRFRELRTFRRRGYVRELLQ